MRSLLLALTLASLAASLSAGCARHGTAGEACQGPDLVAGSFEQCATGFTCTPDRAPPTGNGRGAQWDQSTCREICNSSVDCGPGTTCRVVAGAEYLMACQPN